MVQLQREELVRAYGSFQEQYIRQADRKKLMEAVEAVWGGYGEQGRVLVAAVHLTVNARLALAHSIIFMKIEVQPSWCTVGVCMTEPAAILCRSPRTS